MSNCAVNLQLAVITAHYVTSIVNLNFYFPQMVFLVLSMYRWHSGWQSKDLVFALAGSSERTIMPG